MRILFLTQWFQPESFFKGLPFAKALKEKGHEVEVLAGFPNYPGGKVYPGYRVRLYQQEIMDGVKVHRVPLYPSHDKSAVHRIINYLSFSLSAVLMGPLLVQKPDIIYVYNLVTLGLPAFYLRLLYGSKVVIDVQDLWPESVAGSGMLNNKLMLRVLNSFCNWVYRKADRLVVLSPGFKNHLIDRGIPSETIEVIYNWCDESGIGKNPSVVIERKDIADSERFTILYAGAMGQVQGLETILQCAEICKERLPDVRFVLIGDGADRKRLVQLAGDMKLDNVVFLPPRPIDAMNEIYDMADALIAHLEDIPLFRITIPSKTQAYLYMGKPIIMAVLGDAATLVEQAGAGVVCAPKKPLDMTDAIRSLHDTAAVERQKMGKAGHNYYMRNLCFEKGLNHFEKLMCSLLQVKKCLFVNHEL